jgi:cytochrome oxidase Cu insertion factor (SCO1/SenC/PrrC family)
MAESRPLAPKWLAALSLLIGIGAIAGYALLIRVPSVRNQPEGYVAALAIAATVATLAVALARRWYTWAALAVCVLLLAAGAFFNFAVARIPPAQTNLRVGEAPPDFALLDAGGTRVSLADYRGKKPVVLVFYRGYW